MRIHVHVDTVAIVAFPSYKTLVLLGENVQQLLRGEPREKPVSIWLHAKTLASDKLFSAELKLTTLRSDGTSCHFAGTFQNYAVEGVWSYTTRAGSFCEL